jgi:hypothetical protein
MKSVEARGVGPRAHWRREVCAALLAAIGVFVFAGYLLPESREHSLEEYRRMGAVRAYWEFGRDMVPFGAAAAAFVAVLVASVGRSMRGGSRA